MNSDTQHALAIARKLTEHGVPMFLAKPAMTGREWDPSGGHNKCGYWLPKGWEQSSADPSVIDAWRPGMALCAVMGKPGPLEALDVDPQNGGDQSVARVEHLWPTVYGTANTPSGGTHDFIASLGVGKHNHGEVAPGIDLQGAKADGTGHGFVFLAPTRKLSKASGEIRAYTWIEPPDFARIETEAADDTSGAALAARVRDASTRRTIAQGKTTKPSKIDQPRQNFASLLANPPSEGGRNDWLIRVAGCLAIKHRDNERTYLAEVEKAAEKIPNRLPDTEIASVAASAWRMERTNYPAGKPGEVELDDVPLAAWLAAKVRGQLRWTAGQGWLQYQPEHGLWQSISDVAVVKATIDHLTALFHAEVETASRERYKALWQLRQKAKIDKVAGLLRAYLLTRDDEFDQHPHLLNVGNGVVDLPTSDLLPHDPTLLLTKGTPVDYVPGAEHRDWKQALKALPDEVADWMQARFGQAATGSPPSDDLLIVLQGGGANGKSTVVGGVVAALGSHATVIPERALMANPSDHPTELTTLRGARMALMEEAPGDGRRLSVQRLKTLVGTPTITARAIRKDNITWEATHSLFLTSNYMLRIEETDHGTWRRLALVRFPYTFTTEPGKDADRKRDGSLRQRIQKRRAQREAVLAWVVEGARRWYDADDNLPMPVTVRADTDSWKEDIDVVAAFVSEHLEPDPASCVLSSELFQTFDTWLVGHGHARWNDQTFTARLQASAWAQANDVAKTQTRNLADLSRRVRGSKPPGQKARVWQRVRWREDSRRPAIRDTPSNDMLPEVEA